MSIVTAEIWVIVIFKKRSEKLHLQKSGSSFLRPTGQFVHTFASIKEFGVPPHAVFSPIELAFARAVIL